MSAPRRPPDVAALLAVLEAYDVRHVLAGSVAALAHGVELPPRDLDVVPALDEANLRRLCAALEAVGARPLSFGRWELDAAGERRFIEETPSPELVARWRADPGDLSSLDHLFATTHGDLDVVPEIAGTYLELAPRAVVASLHGRAVLVAHPDDLLACLTVPRRPRYAERVRALRRIQRERGRA